MSLASLAGWLATFRRVIFSHENCEFRDYAHVAGSGYLTFSAAVFVLKVTRAERLFPWGSVNLTCQFPDGNFRTEPSPLFPLITHPAVVSCPIRAQYVPNTCPILLFFIVFWCVCLGEPESEKPLRFRGLSAYLLGAPPGT